MEPLGKPNKEELWQLRSEAQSRGAVHSSQTADA